MSTQRFKFPRANKPQWIIGGTADLSTVVGAWLKEIVLHIYFENEILALVHVVHAIDTEEQWALLFHYVQNSTSMSSL